MSDVPAPVMEWMRATSDPWASCNRADWFIYVARHRGCSARHLAQALARNMPHVRGPANLGEMGDLVNQLVASCAAGTPSATLDEQIRLRVRPRVVDWNVARQYPSGSVPPGIPQRATSSEEPLRAAANAALRLRTEIDGSGTDGWPALVLVAQYIVFARLGSGSPLYNHVEDTPLSARETEVHKARSARFERQPARAKSFA